MLESHKKTIFEILGRNPIHPFPARMAPGIALEALGKSNAPLRVLDPMAGSGTVLAVARSKGHRAFGIDVDPLAVLLAGVWTRTVDPELVKDKAARILDRAKSQFRSLQSGRAYPIGNDDETRKFIRFWFDDYARRQLAALSFAIRRVEDETTRDVLGVVSHASSSRKRPALRLLWTCRTVDRTRSLFTPQSSHLVGSFPLCRPLLPIVLRADHSQLAPLQW